MVKNLEKRYIENVSVKKPNHENFKLTIEILPFIIIKDDTACYYFNRIEGEKARLIFYHYIQQPKFHCKKEIIELTLELLEGNSI